MQPLLFGDTTSMFLCIRIYIVTKGSQFCTNVFLLSRRDPHSLFKYGLFPLSDNEMIIIFILTKILSYDYLLSTRCSFFKLIRVRLNIEVVFKWACAYYASS
jgi:hypothetical protein